MSKERTDADREYERRWYYANKDKISAKKKAKRARLTAIVREAKNVPCVDCGVRYPYYVMDFDHIDPSTKVDIISRLVNQNLLGALVDEIAKCEVVCSNCHRERTFNRQRVVA